MSSNAEYVVLSGTPFADEDPDVRITSSSADPSDIRIARRKVLKFLRSCGVYIGDLCSEFRNDKEVMLSLIYGWESNFNFATTTLKNDREFVIGAIGHHSTLLSKVSRRFRNDKEIVLEALKRDYYNNAMKSASQELKGDKEFAIEALKSGIDPKFLEHCNPSVREDRDVLLHTFKKKAKFFRKVSKNLKDREFLLDAVRINKDVMKIILGKDDNLLGGVDVEFLVAALKLNPRVFFAISACKKWMKKKYVLKFLESGVDIYRYIGKTSEEMKDDREVILAAIRLNPRNFDHVSEKVRNDTEVLELVRSLDPSKYMKEIRRFEGEVELLERKIGDVKLQYELELRRLEDELKEKKEKVRKMKMSVEDEGEVEEVVEAKDEKTTIICKFDL